MIEDLQGERRATAFTLGPLSASEHKLFLETLVGTGIADGLVRRLYKGSEGNPFFTKELVRALVDSGGIVKDDSGAWNLRSRPASHPTRCPRRSRRQWRSGSAACRRTCATSSPSPR